jgi:hypothetical protein
MFNNERIDELELDVRGIRKHIRDLENEAGSILADSELRLRKIEKKVDLLLEHLAMEYKDGPRLEHAKEK